MISFKREGRSKIGGEKVRVSIEATQRQLRHALFEVGENWQRSANESILRGTKTGRVYIRKIKGGRTRKHRSSAPGESHANMTGTLRRSLGWKVSGSKRLVFGYGVIQSAPDYAHNVEVTKNRPSIKNAVNAERRNTMNAIQRAARKAFNP